MSDRPPQIRARHLSQLAIVYARQSSPEQVRNNPGSTETQLGLVELAKQWGWPDSRILIIDDDLGMSGEKPIRRDGFEHTIELMNRCEVGIVFARDPFRLSRRPLDSERFLTTAIERGTLIYVNGHVYDPASRDLAELFGLRIQNLLAWYDNRHRVQTLLACKVAKVRQGFAVSRPVTGYVASAKGKWIKDHDPNVQAAIRRVIELSLQLLSTGKVVKYFRDHDLTFPVRRHGQLIWKPLTRSTVDRIVRNPHYAGHYILRRHPRPGQAEGREDIVYRHHHEPYMSEEEWEQLRALRAARRPVERPPIGKGSALLQGLLWCGQCDRLIRTKYNRRRAGIRVPTYYCRRADAVGDVREHQNYSARHLDHGVVTHVLSVLTPPELEAALAAIDAADSESQSLLETHRRLLRHAEDEVATLRRRYDAVEATHRSVKADLEARLDDALREREERRQALAKAQQAKPPAITPDIPAELLRLAHDLPWLWNAPTAAAEDRKRLLHTVIWRVIVREATEEAIDLEIVWAGGLREALRLLRSRGIDQLVTSLSKTGKTVSEIAQVLQAEDLRTVRGAPISPTNVYDRLYRRGLKRTDALHLAWQRIEALLDEGRSRAQIRAILPVEFPSLGPWSDARLRYTIKKIRRPGDPSEAQP